MTRKQTWRRSIKRGLSLTPYEYNDDGRDISLLSGSQYMMTASTKMWGFLMRFLVLKERLIVMPTERVMHKARGSWQVLTRFYKGSLLTYAFKETFR
jgi:hypothetical protein